MKNKTSELEIGARRVGAINVVGLQTHIAKEIRRFLKVWTQTVAAPGFTTVLFMAIFTWALGDSGRTPAGVGFAEFLAPGLLIMTVLQNAFQNPSSSILIGKVQGNIIDVLMPPLSAGELMAGYAIGGVVRGLAVAAFVSFAFILWPGVDVTIQHYGAAAFYLISASLFMALVGIITGIWAEKFDHSAAINNFIVTPLSLLSGTFYSIQRLPEALQIISHFNPFFYLIDGFRYAMIGRAEGDLVTGALFLTGLNILLWVCAYSMIKRGYKLKS